MAIINIAPIVEGHGEEAALPVLIRRLVPLINPAVYAEVQHPIRQPKDRLLRAGGLEDAVEVAVEGLPQPGLVLVLLDCDDRCPKDEAPRLLGRAQRSAAGRRDVSVVLANREFESWYFLVYSRR